MANGKVIEGKRVHSARGVLHDAWLGFQHNGVCNHCGRDVSTHRTELGAGRRVVCVSLPLPGWVRPGFARLDVKGLGPVQIGVVRSRPAEAEFLGAYRVLNGHGADVTHNARPDGALVFDYDVHYVVPPQLLETAAALAGVLLSDVLACVPGAKRERTHPLDPDRPGTLLRALIDAGHATLSPGAVRDAVTVGGEYATVDGWRVAATWRNGRLHVDDVGYSVAYVDARATAETELGAWGDHNDDAVASRIRSLLGMR